MILRTEKRFEKKKMSHLYTHKRTYNLRTHYTLFQGVKREGERKTKPFNAVNVYLLYCITIT